MLDSFSEEEVADFIAQHEPGLAAARSHVRALHERTDGRAALRRAIGQRPRHTKSLDAWGVRRGCSTRSAIPENLSSIIDHYVARLTLEQRAVLEAAAVCGVEFRVDTAATVLAQDVASVAAICDALARALLWVVLAER